MDVFVRQTSMQFTSRKACGQLDIPQISLKLLNGVFKSDFLYEKLYMPWKKRHANVLEDVLIFANHLLTDKQVNETLLAKINNSEEWDNQMSTSERTEVLAAIRQVSLLLSSMNGHFGIQGLYPVSPSFVVRIIHRGFLFLEVVIQQSACGNMHLDPCFILVKLEQRNPPHVVFP